MIKILVVVFFLCGSEVGIVTNDASIRTFYANPSADLALPPNEQVDMIKINLEELTGLVCV